jgi:hypothetical protein
VTEAFPAMGCPGPTMLPRALAVEAMLPVSLTVSSSDLRFALAAPLGGGPGGGPGGIGAHVLVGAFGAIEVPRMFFSP